MRGVNRYHPQSLEEVPPHCVDDGGGDDGGGDDGGGTSQLWESVVVV